MRPMRKLAIALWLAVFLFAGIRFGAGWKPTGMLPADDSTVNTGVYSGDNSARGPAVKTGDRLPSIRLKDIQGESRDLQDWSGRTLLVNFWATWCAPCRREMPLLEQFQADQDPARMQVIGIAIDRLEPVIRFLGETGVTYPNLVGEMDATRAAEQFGDAFRALPFSVVVGPDGTVLAIHTGEIRAADLEQVAAVAAGLAEGTLTVEAARASLQLGKGPDPVG